MQPALGQVFLRGRSQAAERCKTAAGALLRTVTERVIIKSGRRPGRWPEADHAANSTENIRPRPAAGTGLFTPDDN